MCIVFFMIGSPRYSKDISTRIDNYPTAHGTTSIEGLRKLIRIFSPVRHPHWRRPHHPARARRGSGVHSAGDGRRLHLRLRRPSSTTLVDCWISSNYDNFIYASTPPLSVNIHPARPFARTPKCNIFSSPTMTDLEEIGPNQAHASLSMVYGQRLCTWLRSWHITGDGRGQSHRMPWLTVKVEIIYSQEGVLDLEWMYVGYQAHK